MGHHSGFSDQSGPGDQNGVSRTTGMGVGAGTGSGSAFRRLSQRFRAGRDVRLRDFIARLAAAKPGTLRILDLGGRADYWARVGFDFLDRHDVTVTCVNYAEDELYLSAGKHPRVTAEVGDARALEIPDRAYDMVHSNSVVEHVGRFSDMRAFANETRRLAPAYYVQTPYMWFPIDPHFPRVPMFHWMPTSWRHRLIRRMKVGWGRPCADIDHAMRDLESSVLLDRDQFRELFPDARHRFEWLGLPKSMIAERG